MDTTKKYIKMCREAKEIQKIWKPKAGDCIFAKDSDNGECVVWLGDEKIITTYYGKTRILEVDDYGLEYGSSEEKIENIFKDIAWLPCQDQLQEMVSKNHEEVLRRFIDWLDDGLHDMCWNLDKKLLQKFSSMEQLWLAFVMEKKYNKIWNEKQEKWITLK